MYLRDLINRQDTRNAREVIRFLHLDRFAPELLVFKPKVLEMIEMAPSFFVSHCIFIAKYNVFVLALNEKQKKHAKIEVYSFRQTGIVRDSYIIKNGLSIESQHSVKRSYGWQSCLSSKALFEDDGHSSSSSSFTEDTAAFFANKLQRVEKLMEYALPH